MALFQTKKEEKQQPPGGLFGGQKKEEDTSNLSEEINSLSRKIRLIEDRSSNLQKKFFFVEK